jgi:hypothetical protein
MASVPLGAVLAGEELGVCNKNSSASLKSQALGTGVGRARYRIGD